MAAVDGRSAMMKVRSSIGVASCGSRRMRCARSICWPCATRRRAVSTTNGNPVKRESRCVGSVDARRATSAAKRSESEGGSASMESIRIDATVRARSPTDHSVSVPVLKRTVGASPHTWESETTRAARVTTESPAPGEKTPIIIGSALKALEGDTSDMGEGAIFKLAEALDSFIPEPKRALDGPFLMPVEDVFSISGRGTVVTGRIERGIVKVGEEIEIVGLKPTLKTVCTGVEMFRKLLDQGQAGDNVGVLLRGTKREEVERGQVLAKPGSITPHTKFTAEIYVLSKDEGGRHTPFFNGYRPQFYFRTTDVTGNIELPAGTEMVMPGDNISITVALIQPIAMEEGLRFAIREGGRTVGAGVVAKVIE